MDDMVKRRPKMDTNGYIYETHLHTREASACSNTPATAYIDYMISAGYSGMIVTDHFFTGNSSIPKDLPWEERVDRYCRGYERAKKAASGKDFTVLFGIEYNFEGDEYLLYGVDKTWLLENPDILTKSRTEVYKTVHQYGGIMVHAHPYRDRYYLSTIHLTPSVSDGAEIYNAGNPPWQDALAYRYVKEHSFLPSAGSDIHHLTQHTMGGMRFPYPIKTIQDYVRAFSAGDGTPVFCKDVTDPNEQFRPVEEEPMFTVISQQPRLPVVFH